MSLKTAPEDGHLTYYKAHGISPVRYTTGDLPSHLQMRDSLYRSIGLPALAFRGSDILEVAPGSGQNSLYSALLRPNSLTLVEPNPAGLKDIKGLYEEIALPHTKPNLVPKRLQDFAPEKKFDIVICENWLGALPEEVAHIRKLGSFVAPGGALVLTVVPLAGFFPNVMRKLLALRIVPKDMDFEAKTAALVSVFGPHLATIANMTRSHRDWVHDCMINPHYLNVGLPFGTVLEAVGDELSVLGCYPRIISDWRWFKSLKGKNRRFNESLLESVAANVPSMLDYRRTFPPGAPGAYAALDAAFGDAHNLALSWQASFDAGGDTEAPTARLGAKIASIVNMLEPIDGDLAAAIEELRTVWTSRSPTLETVRDMTRFGPLFGRETFYLALTRGLPQVEGSM